MSTAFVTGATGFIGHHVALVLLENGWSIRAMKREGACHPSCQSKSIDWRIGDLRNRDEVHRAMAGCSVVFHVAADYRLWARHPEELYATNVRGTHNVLQSALDNGVERVVYTSSVGALGLNADGTPANESTPVALEDMIGDYKRSKFLAERIAEKFANSGLPVVIVNPSTPVGPGDHKPTPTGKIIVDFLNRQMPAYLNTGLNLVHVRDVAEGHLRALELGRAGEKYILGNWNLTLADILQILEKVSGLPAPRLRLPYKPVLLLARGLDIISRITGKEPLVPYEGVKMAKRLMFFDSSKAIRELGLPQTPVESALTESVSWFQNNGYVFPKK